MKIPLPFFKKNPLHPRSRRLPKLHPKYGGDRWLVLATALLAALGILMVYDSSVAIAIRDFANPIHFVREQLKWLILGFGAFFGLSLLDYRIWRKAAVAFLLISLVLLLAVFIPGFGVVALGARRWLDFRVFILQPAEVAKLAVVVYLSAWFATKERGRFGAFLLLLGMVVGLILLEPDLGTAAILLLTALILYFYSGSPLLHFAALVPAMTLLLIGLSIAAPYRFRRITTFFNPEADPLGASYQIRQILLSLGSGGLFGVGLGKSRQKYEYLPEANTDSIFAIVGEEMGFIGAVLVIGLFLFLIWRCFRIARRSPDSFGRLLALGVGSWIGIQTLVNLGSMVALLPLTGVPLPLISYGGSNLVITLAALGIVWNISKHRS